MTPPNIEVLKVKLNLIGRPKKPNNEQNISAGLLKILQKMVPYQA